MYILTGRPVFLDMIAAAGSMYGLVLPPKPPPISIGITFTSAMGMPSMCATVSRIANGPCDDVQIVSVPSGFQ